MNGPSHFSHDGGHFQDGAISSPNQKDASEGFTMMEISNTSHYPLKHGSDSFMSNFKAID